ncbi:MAG TPA: cell division protein FtsQ/DivIB [Burkholderiales bacterium]|nr:cell division protein FtsQ/DivIB [Burkholderiales bacterium]
MWDRPDLLNRISTALFTVAFLLFVYALTWIVVRQPVFALRHVEITGDAQHVTSSQVETIVQKELKGTFFTLNLPRLRAAFEKLPWVREVRLRRHWPDRLEVSVVEHVPLARWGGTALVNTEGEVFHAAHDGKLPVFVGPEGTSKEMAIQYEHFKRSLASIGAKPVLVQVSARRAWQVRLENGPMLQLGREDVEARLARYIEYHERTVGALKRRVDYIDLRYANGFAVRIPELKGEPRERERARAKKAKRV